VDINKKIAYLTNPKCRHQNKLKTKDPIALQNKYFAKKIRKLDGSTKICHDEMMEMLDCLKRNKGCNKKCGEFITTLLSCEKQYKADQEQIALDVKASGKTPDGRVDAKVANHLLSRHPNQHDQQAWNTKRNLLVKLDSVKIQPFPYEDNGREYKGKV